VDGAEHVAQELPGCRILLQRQQIGIELVEVLVGFDQELGNDLIYRFNDAPLNDLRLRRYEQKVHRRLSDFLKLRPTGNLPPVRLPAGHPAPRAAEILGPIFRAAPG